MSPDDPRHGSTKGYRAGCSERCCREAQNAYERRRRKHRQVYGTELKVDATGTRRRIHALMALGHNSKTIAEACGWTTGEAVLEVSRRSWVQVKTAKTLAAAFEELGMVVGASAETRRRAQRQGWLPPLAWDNIDDPDEKPSIGRDINPGGGLPWRELLAEYEFFTGTGMSEQYALERLGVTEDAIWNAKKKRRLAESEEAA